jgi:hypothetical protein
MGASGLPRLATDLAPLREYAQRDIAESFGELRATDDDIAPRAYLMYREVLDVLVLPGNLMGSEDVKARVLGGLLPEMVRREHATAVAVTFTIFGSHHKAVPDLSDDELQALKRGENPAGWPPRKRWRKPEEQMLVLLSSPVEELWWAQIVRIHQQRPTLGYWGTRPDAVARGAMFTDIRAALAERAAPGGDG